MRANDANESALVDRTRQRLTSFTIPAQSELTIQPKPIPEA
jgi:hypothetical protein